MRLQKISGFAVFFSLFLTGMPSALCAEAQQRENWFAQEETRLQVKIKKVRANKRAGQDTLDESKKMLKHALENDEEETAEVSRQVIEHTEQALRNSGIAQDRIAQALKALREVLKSTKDHKLTDFKIGIVTTIEGDVEIKVEGKWAPLNRIVIKEGTEIRTGSDSYAQMKFQGGTTVTMDKESSVKVEKLGPRATMHEYIKGRILFNWARLKALSLRKRSIRVNTTESSVRGTKAMLEPGKKGSVILTVLKGEIEFEKQKTNKKKVSVKKGEQVVIAHDGSVSKPVAIDLRSIKQWWEVQ
ncbi:FecR domain-containing protein [Elusimicrobiota bacterium]